MRNNGWYNRNLGKCVNWAHWWESCFTTDRLGSATDITHSSGVRTDGRACSWIAAAIIEKYG